MSLVKRAVLMVMVALWLPSASHCLLEDLGWIHEDHAANDSDFGHDAADGNCHLATSGTSLRVGLSHCFFVSNGVDLAGGESCFEFRADTLKSVIPGTAPPAEILHSWQFLFRAALPVRAPSLAS